MKNIAINLFFLSLLINSFKPSAQNISTYAGGGNPDNIPALTQSVSPKGVIIDASGNVYISDYQYNRILKLDVSSGIISTVSGNASAGFGGDGGLATQAQLNNPNALAIDYQGNIYISDGTNGRIRKVDNNGIITTVAGNGDLKYSGDGGPAISAGVYVPVGVAVDKFGNIYISDSGSKRIRKVDTSGNISTIVGTGTSGYSGDGGLATAATLRNAKGIAVDVNGDLLIADAGNHCIRKVSMSTGIISTIVGNGTSGNSGDGGTAANATLIDPETIYVDPSGNIFIGDIAASVVREVDGSTGIIKTIAGTGSPGYNNKTGVGTSVMLNQPSGIVADKSGNLYIGDLLNHFLRKLSLATSTITVVAGNGSASVAGIGGLAINARLDRPAEIIFDQLGNLYFSDTSESQVFKIDISTGVITLVAGNGIYSYTGDGKQATSAGLHIPIGIIFDAKGNLFIADQQNHVVRKVNASTGVISTVAGQGINGYTGDGKLATTLLLSYPCGLAIDQSGNLLIADQGNNRIRKVDASTGIMTTIAGTGTAGFSGDGGIATKANLNGPSDFSLDASGNIYFNDEFNYRVRKIDATTGVISTIAGVGKIGDSGDGGAALSAKIKPSGMFLDKNNNVYLVEMDYHKVRMVDAITGIITTTIGNGTAGFSGDQGPAISAEINQPGSGNVDSYGNIYISDGGNHRIRKVILQSATIPMATTASNITSTGFTANWNSVTGATGYQLDISTDNFATFLTGYNSKVETGTSQIVTGLTAGASYQYRVRATSTSGTSTNSNVISVTTPSSITAPVATAATSVTSTGFTANWSSVTGATSYQLDVSTDNFTTFLTGYNSKVVTGTSQILTGLTAGTSYQYRVRATSSSGTSANSNVISVTTQSSITAPVASAASGITNTGFTANWNSVSTATGYQLDISTDNFATFLTGYNSKVETGTSQIVTGLPAGISYQYRVRATSTSGTSTNSNVISVTTISPVQAPFALAATGVLSTGFTANWSNVTSATSYQLDISIDDFVTFIAGYNSKSVSGTSQIVTGLTLGATYKYRVRAVGVSGSSINSNVITVITPTKSNQIITFNPIPHVTIGDSPIVLVAFANSGLPISFTSKNTPAALVGNTFLIVLPGRDTITANQPGNFTYLAATPVKQTFCINPAQPEVTISNDNTATPTLVSSANSGNQWFLNGTPITGATNKTLNITSPGVYTVTVQADDCVSIPSDLVPIIVTGDIASLSTQPILYPNPTRDFIFIAGIREAVTASFIIDQIGHYSSSIELEKQGDVLKGNVNSLNSGLYILQVNEGGKVHQIKFIKQ